MPLRPTTLHGANARSRGAACITFCDRKAGATLRGLPSRILRGASDLPVVGREPLAIFWEKRGERSARGGTPRTSFAHFLRSPSSSD